MDVGFIQEKGVRMKKGLLLGNGINSRIGVDSFSVDNIWRRFIENIRKYKPVFEATFDITIYEDEIVDVLLNSSNRGIETLAGTVYKYICDKIGSKWSTNDDIRLQDLLTCIAITTIFLDENGKKKVNYKVDQLPDFSVYDMVFTLNYYEFWDYNHIAVPLHGRVDLDAIHENINVLVSSLRMSYDKYRETVEKVARNNKVQIVNLSDIIFAPSAVIKEHLICVEGIYPSNRLFPADDLYLIKKQKLYEDIKNVDELDIFGMSPYGDDSLIHIINTKLKVRVFIYNKDSNHETREWMRKLTCPYELLDSGLI